MHTPTFDVLYFTYLGRQHPDTDTEILTARACRVGSEREDPFNLRRCLRNWFGPLAKDDEIPLRDVRLGPGVVLVSFRNHKQGIKYCS